MTDNIPLDILDPGPRTLEVDAGTGVSSNQSSSSSGPSLRPHLTVQTAPSTVLDVNEHGFPHHIESILSGMPTLGSSSVAPLHRVNPKERFRASVHKVIQFNRVSTILSNGPLSAGAEPGIDPRRRSACLNYGHIRQNCVIEVFDYSSTNAMVGKMTNREFVSLMKDANASTRDAWVKVRWINVGGISWDVISAFAIRYDLHPLAVEDVLHRQRNLGRSKADYYPKHLFLRIMRHCLADEDENIFDKIPLSQSPVALLDEGWVPYSTSTLIGVSERDGRVRAGDERSAPLPHDSWRLPFGTSEKRHSDELTIEKLKEGAGVKVDITPFLIFLLRDGTVISINPEPTLMFTEPIVARLKQLDTTLRVSADASLLVQSLIDFTVDQALEVVDAYEMRLQKLERQVLLKASMKTVRCLHIISGDLILHKRTLAPIRSVIYALRRYDLDRSAAIVETGNCVAELPVVKGYMSHKAKIYLADVFDHMEYILASIDMFANVSENLIDYTFNMTNCEISETMRRLTLATITFLPMTLLTGYFGMNFTQFWAVYHNSDIFFWEVALPILSVVVVLFMWPDFIRIAHYVHKRLLARRVT